MNGPKPVWTSAMKKLSASSANSVRRDVMRRGRASGRP